MKGLYRRWKEEGIAAVPVKLDNFLAHVSSFAKDDWREQLDIWSWALALLKATREDGSMFSRSWDTSDTVINSTELPVVMPLLKRAEEYNNNVRFI